MPRIANPEQRRADVVAASYRLLARDGVDAFSMRAVAKEANCTIGLINHWFDSKGHLVDAALAQAVDTAIQRSHAVVVVDHTDDIETALQEFLPLDEVRAAEVRVGIAFWALSMGRPQLKAQHQQRYQMLRQHMSLEAKKLSTSKPRQILFVDVLMALLDGLAINAILDPEYWSKNRQLKSLRWTIRALLNEPD